MCHWTSTRECVSGRCVRAYLKENVNCMQTNKISLCLEIILIGIRFNERRGDCSLCTCATNVEMRNNVCIIGK